MGLSSNELAARIALLKKDRAMSTEMMEEKCASSMSTEKALTLFKSLGKVSPSVKAAPAAKEKALNLFKRLGKNKEFVIVGKPGADVYDTNKHIWRAARQQRPIQAIRGTVRKLSSKEGLQSFDEGMRGMADAQVLGGTIAPGRKGTKSYIARGMASGDRSGRPGLREVLHHEGFHAKVPILGSSEILAHAYGGLKSKKGRLDPAQSVNALKHLWATRPGRATFEAGVGAGVVGGGAALASHVKKRTDKKEVDSAKTAGLNIGVMHNIDPHLADKLKFGIDPKIVDGIKKTMTSPRTAIKALLGIGAVTGAASLGSSLGKGVGDRLTKKAFWEGFANRSI